MKYFPSIGYNGMKWTASMVKYLEEKSGKPVTIAERMMLATKWVLEEKHYTLVDSTRDRIFRGAKC
jgi:hypothetical protein